MEYCRLSVPSMKPFSLSQTKNSAIGPYEGTGLENGQCGIKINQVKDAYNGLINCTAGVKTQSEEIQATMKLIVAREYFRIIL